VRTAVVHGHRRAFVLARHRRPDAPVLLLLHGIGSDLRTWDEVIAPLSKDFTVVAPDLLGHGQSAKPRADYSLGGYANGMRDLLSLLDIERATIVGHSFGGGVAMQFAYQYPERCERAVLVSTGGLGREVTPLLRSVTLPGAGLALAAAELPPARWATHLMAPVLARLPFMPGREDVKDTLQVFDNLADPGARRAFLHVARSALDWRGQVVTMLDRCYLTAEMPIMVVWGDKDTAIPMEHADVAAQAMPGVRVEVIEGGGHFPHRLDPAGFAALVRDFVLSTSPSVPEPSRLRRLLRSGGRPQAAAALPPSTMGTSVQRS
jgi:pimeloyl-ACP methyl ester carboxylesterase